MTNIDLDELKKLIEEWLKTLDDSSEYWDGVYCSNRVMAESFICGKRPFSKSFLAWLKDR